MGWKGALRAAEAAHRRRERDEVKRLRELERLTREKAQLSALEEARLEVDSFESRLNVLLSIHREPIDTWNWLGLAAALDPCVPINSATSELLERLHACAEARPVEGSALDTRRADDQRFLQQALVEYASSQQARKRNRDLAARVLHADLDAWTEAIAHLRPFQELEELGVTVNAEFYSRDSVHCSITVSGPEVIPHEAKSLTSTGKLSVKPMAKGRFHEIYQDYVCGCVLRTASEMFGFVPVEAVLVTAFVGFIDPSTGQFGIRPVLSVGFTRSRFSDLALDKVDPSDAIEGFVHRGDAKASRKTGTFVPVEPLRLEDIHSPRSHSVRFNDALERLRRERDEIREQAKILTARLRTPESGAISED